MTRLTWAPYAVAGVVAAAGIGGFVQLSAFATDRANLRLVEQNTVPLAAFCAAVPRVESALAMVTEGAASSPAAFGPAVEVLRRESAVAGAAIIAGGRPVTTAGADLSWADVLSNPAATEVLGLARDSGAVAASRPVVTPSARVTLLAVPSYRAPASGTEERRRLIDSHLVVALDARRLARQTFGDSLLRTIKLDVTDGGISLLNDSARAVAVDQDSLRADIGVGTRHWRISVGAGAIGPPSSAWVLLGIGLASAALLVAIARLGRHAHREATAAAETRAQELELVVSSGALLQESLDLSDVLPSFSVRLSEQLDLRGVAIAVATDAGHLVDVFATASTVTPAPGRVAELSPPPDTVAPGATVSIPLERDRRVIGALRITPTRGLDRQQTNAVRAAAELLAAALANAALYHKEQESVRRLQEVNQLKTAFLGTVSHELRTPLVAIRGFAELLQGQWNHLDDASRRDCVDRIARNAQSLSNLMQDVLDLASLERQVVNISVEELDLSAQVSSIVAQTSSLLNDHPTTTEIAPELRGWSDANAVERILSNLLGNAAKFSPPGAPIAVRLESDGSKVCLTVDDAGPGIPEAERARIFERFYRGDTTAAITTKGTGIGLAIVKELADRVGAELEVGDSRWGGARFTVRFPMTAPDVDTARSVMR